MNSRGHGMHFYHVCGIIRNAAENVLQPSIKLDTQSPIQAYRELAQFGYACVSAASKGPLPVTLTLAQCDKQ
eukprot:354266-Chlamydomonas_euryale.AAC.7